MGEKAPFFESVNQATKFRTILNYKLIIRGEVKMKNNTTVKESILLLDGMSCVTCASNIEKN